MARSSLQIVLSIVTKTNFKQTGVVFWAASCINKPDEFYYGYNIDDLFEKLIKALHVTKVYIHDDDYALSYIYNYLLKKGYLYDENMDTEKRDFDQGSYNMFIVNSKCMFLKVRYKTDYASTCTFMSSKNILRNSVKEICTSYDCGIDINDIVDESIQLNYDNKLTDRICDMTVNSSKVLARAIHNVKSTMSLTELTVGSNAVKSWKKLDKDQWQKLAILPQNVERDIYLSYRGGYNWLNPLYKEKDIGEGVVLDVNSLFPYIMKEFDLPIGLPTWSKKLPYNSDGSLYKYCIIKLKLDGDYDNPAAKVKNGHLPCISNMCQENKQQSMIYNEYLDKLYATTLWLTGWDFEMMLNNYDVDSYIIDGCYIFDVEKGLFDNFINFWYDIKRNSKGAKRELSKLMLDNLHGKLGTKVENLRGGQWVHQQKQRLIMTDNGVEFGDGGDTNNTSIRYMPASIFINSIARYMIIMTAQYYYDRLIYIDTDGIHLEGLEHVDIVINGEKVINISDKLGDFKVESIFKRAKYLGLKNYIHDEYTEFDKFDNTFKHNDITSCVVKMAGASEKVRNKVNWDNFYYDSIIENSKTIMFNLPGGKVRKLTNYSIRKRSIKKD